VNEPTPTKVDQFLSRYTAPPPADVIDTEVEAADDGQCWGYLRGARERAVMLELRKRDGNILAVSYAWLDRVEYDPSSGICLHLGGKEINVIGNNLRSARMDIPCLFTSLVRHRCLWIKECLQEYSIMSDGSVVQSLMW
jgi:hypothetical protein